jgi:hypothetical protein
MFSLYITYAFLAQHEGLFINGRKLKLLQTFIVDLNEVALLIKLLNSLVEHKPFAINV